MVRAGRCCSGAARFVCLHLAARAVIDFVADFDGLAVHALLLGFEDLLCFAGFGSGGFRDARVFQAEADGFLRGLGFDERLFRGQGCLFGFALQHFSIAGPGGIARGDGGDHAGACGLGICGGVFQRQARLAGGASRIAWRGWRPASRSARSSRPAHHPAQTLPSLSSLLSQLLYSYAFRSLPIVSPRGRKAAAG